MIRKYAISWQELSHASYQNEQDIAMIENSSRLYKRYSIAGLLVARESIGKINYSA